MKTGYDTKPKPPRNTIEGAKWAKKITNYRRKIEQRTKITRDMEWKQEQHRHRKRAQNHNQTPKQGSQTSGTGKK